MCSPLLNDFAQRLLTGNKAFQKQCLAPVLQAASARTKVLDFGCSTGVLAPFVSSKGLHYHGYDIDEPALSLAARRNPGLDFTSDRDLIRRNGPYEVIFAFSCFHHIDDATLAGELNFLRDNLDQGGTFLFMDILAVPDDPSWGHRMFMKLEQGRHVRLEHQYAALVSGTFTVRHHEIRRSTLFSLPFTVGPVYNDCLVLTCER